MKIASYQILHSRILLQSIKHRETAKKVARTNVVPIYVCVGSMEFNVCLRVVSVMEKIATTKE